MGEVPVGHHIILDLFKCECEQKWLLDLRYGRRLMTAASKGLNVLGMQEHQFKPHSYSICVLLEESHLSIHTWTQHNFASMDFYTCTGKVPEECVFVALGLLKPRRTVRLDIKRGTTHPTTRTETDYHAGQ